ncbi:MAG: Polysaccharide deacetylase family protein locus subfamily [Rhodospirillales bacterium]|nr:Polysaccharide deacetylase family protein locus subfamily [Rhodospirillales bacterium]
MQQRAQTNDQAGTGSKLARGITNAMSVDVEDWFQVWAFEGSGAITRPQWESFPRRVEANTDRLLGLFADAEVKATFFTLGWVAERHPSLIRRIVEQGHELASHGWDHTRADAQTPEQFRADIRRTKRALEAAGGCEVVGYRAATFSIGPKNPWAFEVLAEEGYRYDSSTYPVKHDFYGDVHAPREPHRRGNLLEVPMTTCRRMGRTLPAAGGGWFRLLPYGVSRANLRRVVDGEKRPAVFYFHPWEIDSGQPRVRNLPWKTRVRHYTGLSRMEAKLSRLLRDFAWDRMDRVFLK